MSLSRTYKLPPQLLERAIALYVLDLAEVRKSISTASNTQSKNRTSACHEYNDRCIYIVNAVGMYRARRSCTGTQEFHVRAPGVFITCVQWPGLAVEPWVLFCESAP